jgi:hypothetical protein
MIIQLRVKLIITRPDLQLWGHRGNMSIYLSVCLSVYLSIYLSIYLPVQSTTDHCRSRCKGREGLPLIHSLIRLSVCLSVCLSIYLSIYLSSCCSHLENRVSVKRFVSLQFLNMGQSVGLLGRGISPTQGRYLHTHRIKVGKHQCLEWDSNPRSFRASEDTSCLRPRGHCDRRRPPLSNNKFSL